MVFDKRTSLLHVDIDYPGSAKANGREPKSCLDQVFNFKLVPFVM